LEVDTSFWTDLNLFATTRFDNLTHLTLELPHYNESPKKDQTLHQAADLTALSHHSLESLHIKRAQYNMDLSPFFECLLGLSFHQLTDFSATVGFTNDAMKGHGAVLSHFLRTHGSRFRRFVLLPVVESSFQSLFDDGPPYDFYEGYIEYLNIHAGVFRNLNQLGLSFAQVRPENLNSVVEVLRLYFTASASTLVELCLDDNFIDHLEFARVLDALHDCLNKGAAQLQSLSINIQTLTPGIVDALVRQLPNLQSLNIQFLDIAGEEYDHIKHRASESEVLVRFLH
jgi:hypothetical protein